MLTRRQARLQAAAAAAEAPVVNTGGTRRQQRQQQQGQQQHQQQQGQQQHQQQQGQLQQEQQQQQQQQLPQLPQASRMPTTRSATAAQRNAAAAKRNAAAGPDHPVEPKQSKKSSEKEKDKKKDDVEQDRLMGALPVELLLHICSFLRACDLLRLGDASRGWRRLTAEATLWRDATFDLADHDSGEAALLRAHRRGVREIGGIQVPEKRYKRRPTGEFFPVTLKGLEACRHPTKVKEVLLDMKPRSLTLLIEAPGDDFLLRLLRRVAPFVEELVLTVAPREAQQVLDVVSKMPALRRLRLRLPTYERRRQLDLPLLPALPTLRELDVDGRFDAKALPPQVEALTLLYPNGEHLQLLATGFPRLRKLRLVFLRRAFSDEAQPDRFPDLPRHLQELGVAWPPKPEEAVLAALRLPRLRCLDLHMFGWPADMDLPPPPPGHCGLQRLRIYTVTGFLSNSSLHSLPTYHRATLRDLQLSSLEICHRPVEALCRYQLSALWRLVVLREVDDCKSDNYATTGARLQNCRKAVEEVLRMQQAAPRAVFCSECQSWAGPGAPMWLSQHEFQDLYLQ